MTSSIYSVPNRNRVVFFCAAAILIVALIVLAGWFFDIVYLKSILPDYPEMKPNTAVAFAVVGVGLLFLTMTDRGGRPSYTAIICGVVVCLIGALTLCEYITGFDFGIDNYLIPISNNGERGVLEGRMSPHSALNFTILGISLALLNGRQFLQKINEVLVFLVSMTTFAALLGLLYGAQRFYGAPTYNSMALHAAGLFFLCSFGFLAANTQSRIVRLVTSDSLGGTAARRLFPAVVLIPTVLGWLRVIGQERGLYDTGFGAALTISSSVFLMFAIIYFYSETVHLVDQRRKKAEKELAGREARYRDLFDQSQGLICIHDLNGILSAVNPAGYKSLDFDLDEMMGRSIRDFMPEAARFQFDVYLRTVETDGRAEGSLPLVSKNGRQLVWRYHNILIAEADKEPYVLGHAQDVTEHLEAEKALKNLSLTDDLTGLYNRRGFQTMAEQQIKLEQHESTARGLILMFADLDGLKQINDVHGHEVGSDAIIQFSRILSAAMRSSDIISRWGGDEFVMLTIGLRDENAEMMSERISRKIREYNSTSGKPYKIACSIGVAPIPPDGSRTFESIIAEADKAMYAEKKRRKETLEIPMR